jgi:MoxR-like ATPase
MKALRHPLPLRALLDAYAGAAPSADELDRRADWGPRWHASAELPESLLDARFLEGATATEFHAAVARLYEACVPWPLHPPSVRDAGIVRHALGHLRHGGDPLPLKVERCLAVDGAYRVAGLGPAFWSAVLQGVAPAPPLAWTPTVAEGLRRLGLLRGRPCGGWDRRYAAWTTASARLRQAAPALSMRHLEVFCSAVARMDGRDLAATVHTGDDLFRGAVSPARVAAALAGVRARTALRARLRERGRELAEARGRLKAGLADADGDLLRRALEVADPESARQAQIDWAGQGGALAAWLGRLRDAADPFAVLAEFWRAQPVSGAGLWLPAAALHLRDPYQFPAWPDAVRQGFALLDDAGEEPCPAACYRLFAAGATRFRERIRAHPLEVADLLAALGQPRESAVAADAGSFRGFTPDAFRFLGELAANNSRAWMDRNRERYHFSLRKPLAELCAALTVRYVDPVLRREYGWDLETIPRAGRALTSVGKNDYGRSAPYQDALWLTFYRRNPGGRRSEAQLFVRADGAGLTYGFRIGQEAKAARTHFHERVTAHADTIHHLLAAGTREAWNFGGETRPTSPADLVAWAAGPSPTVGKRLAPESPELRCDALVGDILLTFDRLLPLLACALEADPGPLLTRLAAPLSAVPAYDDGDFLRDTHLDGDWLHRARKLLDLKGQLILQGVPGTGKTHVARCLARLIAGGDHAVRLVQFHPAYSYEEFVEGIRVRTVEHDGRHDVTYPVEDGLLCAFAAEADRRPSEPFVLIIDEINRGNLPRIFGELLYLLEYRGQAVRLPYSQRPFRLPTNLIVLGTMNAADRSVALVDQALRRRFSFVDMPPDAAVLKAWLGVEVPDAAFAARVVGLFERLNGRLCGELGPNARVGHSYFMTPGLDEGRLRVIWQHHVRPLLDELFAGRPGRADAYDLDELLAGKSRPARPRRTPVGAAR